MPATEPTPLRAARLRAGLTQPAVAARLGVTTQTYGDYERGRRNPTLNWLMKAAAAIGCNPSDLDQQLASRPAAAVEQPSDMH